MKNIVLTHNDLDGVCAGYLAGQAFDTNIVTNTSYTNVMKNLEKYSKEYGYVNIIITDLNILPVELKYALENFKTVTIFDHHPSSANFIPLMKINDRFKIYYNDLVCATTLVEKYMMDEQGHEFTDVEKNFYRYVNIYDLWKTTHKEFTYARIANDLFWDYGIAYFYQKLKANGAFDIPDGLTHEELRKCKETFLSVERSCAEAEWYNTDCGSTIVILEEDQKTAINHISTHKESETGIFYILYYGRGYNCSSRVNAENNNNYQLGADWASFLKESDLILNCGGHDNASGLTFKKDVDLPTALKEVERFDSFMFERMGKSCSTE